MLFGKVSLNLTPMGGQSYRTLSQLLNL